MMRAILQSGVSLLFLVSCVSEPDRETYGLRGFEIRMRSEDAGGVFSGARAHIRYPSTVRIEGNRHRAQVSAAGASTIHHLKKSLNVEFSQERSFESSTDLRLATAIKDPSQLRTLIALEIFEAAGVPVPEARPAFVHLNDQVLGLYLQVEKVNEDFLRNRGIRPTQLYEADDRADFGTDFEGRVHDAISAKLEPKSLEVFVHLARLVQSLPDPDFEREVFTILDRDQVIRYMAAGKVTNQWDGFNKNVYYYAGADGKLRLVPWDFDLAWAIGIGGNPEVWSINDLFTRIGRLPSARVEIDAQVSLLLSGVASPSRLDERFEHWSGVIARAYDADPFLGGAGRSLVEESRILRKEIDLWLSRLR